MERMKAQDFPQDLLNLFDRYVHGDIGRREFWTARKVRGRRLDGHGDIREPPPQYAWAQQVAKDDSRIKTEYATYPRHRAMEAFVAT